ncbi:MAG TPA: hypothetical protein VGD75_16605, partial [Bradyrhizobium sp.]
MKKSTALKKNPTLQKAARAGTTKSGIAKTAMAKSGIAKTAITKSGKSSAAPVGSERPGSWHLARTETERQL